MTISRIILEWFAPSIRQKFNIKIKAVFHIVSARDMSRVPVCQSERLFDKRKQCVPTTPHHTHTGSRRDMQMGYRPTESYWNEWIKPATRSARTTTTEVISNHSKKRRYTAQTEWAIRHLPCNTLPCRGKDWKALCSVVHVPVVGTAVVTPNWCLSVLVTGHLILYSIYMTPTMQTFFRHDRDQ